MELESLHRRHRPFVYNYNFLWCKSQFYLYLPLPITIITHIIVCEPCARFASHARDTMGRLPTIIIMRGARLKIFYAQEKKNKFTKKICHMKKKKLYSYTILKRVFSKHTKKKLLNLIKTLR